LRRFRVIEKLRQLRRRLEGWWILFQVEKLHTKKWGRQPDGDAIMRATDAQPDAKMITKMPVKTSIQVRVWRESTHEWEDYGVVSSTDKRVTLDEWNRMREILNRAIGDDPHWSSSQMISDWK